MKTIEKYVEAMQNKDYVALSQLFDDNGSYNDFCTRLSMKQNEYHVFGKEGIEMFFRNKFAFFQYGISEAKVTNDHEATFISNMGGYYVKAVAKIEEFVDNDDENKIIKLVVRPK